MSDQRSPARGTKRPYSEMEDEDGREATRVKTEPAVKTEAGETGETVTTKNTATQTARDRIVMLNFTHGYGKYSKSFQWPILERSLAQVPKYAKKIAAAKASTALPARLSISEDGSRFENDMFGLVSYLSTGSVEPVDHSCQLNLENSLSSLVSLISLGKTLKVKGLENAAGAMLAQQTALDAKTFIMVASMCCGQKDVDTSDNSVVGKWIRGYLSTNAEQLEAGGHIGRLTESGGALAAIMIKVLMKERHAGRKTGGA